MIIIAIIYSRSQLREMDQKTSARLVFNVNNKRY